MKWEEKFSKVFCYIDRHWQEEYWNEEINNFFKMCETNSRCVCSSSSSSVYSSWDLDVLTDGHTWTDMQEQLDLGRNVSFYLLYSSFYSTVNGYNKSLTVQFDNTACLLSQYYWLTEHKIDSVVTPSRRSPTRRMASSRYLSNDIWLTGRH